MRSRQTPRPNHHFVIMQTNKSDYKVKLVTDATKISFDHYEEIEVADSTYDVIFGLDCPLECATDNSGNISQFWNFIFVPITKVRCQTVSSFRMLGQASQILPIEAMHLLDS